MKPLGSVAALLAAIRDDAAAETEAIARDADATVVRITGDSAGCPAPSGNGGALADARDHARVRLSQEDWDDAREALAERERWIVQAVAIGTNQLRERQPVDRVRAELALLAREAVGRLPPGAIEIVVSEADAGLLDREWRALVAPVDPDSIRVIAGAIDGGCIARSADGRASFDNTYSARAERLQAAWRAELADLYEEATSHLHPRSAPEVP